MKSLDNFEECMHKIRFLERVNSDSAVAEVLKMPPSTFNEHKKRRQLPMKNLLMYCQDRGVSIDWLMLKSRIK